MQRVVSINLNGNAYQLEENGYNALFAYLDAADAQLKDNPERAQMVADLEARVAELCQAYLSPHKTVVTSMDVDRIIAQLGAQLGAEPGPIPGQPDADAGRTPALPARRHPAPLALERARDRDRHPPDRSHTGASIRSAKAR